MSDIQFWQNKIVGYDEVDPESLLAHDSNWRIHPAHQQEALKGALSEIGWIQDIIVNKRTSPEWGADQNVETVLDGHLRVTLALRHDQPKVPIKYVDLTPQQEALALATFDPISATAAADREKLGALLQNVQSGNEGVQSLLAGLAEREGVFFGGNGNEPPEDPGAQIDKAAELQEKWGVETGDLWVIPSNTASGEHRVICGDCTDPEIMATVGVADLLFIDPPYGVKRDKGFGGFGGFGPPIARRQYEDDWDSERPTKETLDMLRATAGNALIFGGNFLADILPRSTHWIAWDKLNTMPTFGDCELIWTSFARLSVKKITFEYNGLIGKEVERFHPTQKPLGLCELLLKEYSKEGESVLDCYAGSGTTLVACERLARLGRGVEVHAPYVSVCLERLSGMGLEPELLERA